MSRFQTLCVASIAVIVLGLLTAIHLDRQGTYYDELHQAPSAFHYIGSNPILFTWAYHGVPMLNMTYSGAIKSGIYGLLLRYGLHHFSVFSWRMLGIAFVAAGLFGFYVIAGRFLPIDSAVVFATLLLTDGSVILMTRHDWGPTALALGLRLIFLGLWISIRSDEPPDYKIALAAFVVGLSVFEKLSSIVLLAPLLILLLTVKTRGKRSWIAAALGLFVGASPLIVANVATYRLEHRFISLTDATPDKDPLTLESLTEYIYGYLSLGHGETMRHDILGEVSNLFLVRAETTLIALILLTLLLSSVVGSTRFWKTNRRLWFAAVLAGTYLAVAAALLMLPRATFVHHWIIGTPFQYAAIALGLAALERSSRAYKIFLPLVLCLVAVRLPTLAKVERSVVAGKTAVGYDPVFNQLGQFAAAHANDAVFISSDWGSATQLYCGSNGADNTMFEAFWGTDPAGGALNIAASTKKNTLYIVTTGLAPQFSQASAAIIRAIMTSPDWQNMPVDEFTDSGPIQIRKFVRKEKS